MISAELAQAIAAVDAAEAHRLAQAILTADAVFVAGEGRSGLIARCFAMRLLHLGRRAYVAGETTAPAAEKGHLLIAVSRSGDTRVTCTRAEVARARGLHVAAITATPGSPLAKLATLQLLLSAESDQYGGSLFEQTALVVLDGLALLLQHRLGQTSAEMDARHANLE